MSFSFGTSTGTATTKPVRGTATMADWKAWVDGLSRYERDQLYPGMHKDLIPAYEMIEAQEERKRGGQSSAFSTDFGSVTSPSLPASTPLVGTASPASSSSTSNPARPKGLLDIDYTTFKPGALTATTGLSRSTPSQNTLPGAAAYVPYQPYTPPSYGQPLSPAMSPAMSPAPTLPAPAPAPGLAPSLPPSLASPIGTAPAPSVFGTTVPGLLSGSPFNTAPAPALGTPASVFAAPGPTNPATAPFPAFGNPLTTAPATSALFAAAAGLPTPATRPDTPLKGLLDQSYVKSPAGNAMANAASQYAGSDSDNAARLGNPGIIGDPGKALDDFLNPKSTSEIVTEVALRLAHKEVIQVFKDFWAYYNTASEAEKSQIHSELRGFGLSMVPGVGEVIDLNATLASEKDNIAKGLTAIAIILSALIPVLGKGRKILRFWRWFKSVAKRTAKKAVKVWTKDAVRSMVRDAALGLAEELAAQIIANGYSYKNWNSYDLGISAASGAVTGAIGQMPNETIAAWSDIANAMFTALARETFSSGNSLEDLVTATERAGWKTILMGASTFGMQWLLKRFDVSPHYHEPIMVTVNVGVDKFWDAALDMWYAQRE